MKQLIFLKCHRSSKASEKPCIVAIANPVEHNLFVFRPDKQKWGRLHPSVCIQPYPETVPLVLTFLLKNIRSVPLIEWLQMEHTRNNSATPQKSPLSSPPSQDFVPPHPDRALKFVVWRMECWEVDRPGGSPTCATNHTPSLLSEIFTI